MKISSAIIILTVLTLSSLQYGMARQGQYDEEAREQERFEKTQRKAMKSEKISPAKNFVGGLEEATVGSTKAIVDDTTEGAKEQGPIVGTLEGANKATGTAFDKTLKGAVKVATLGYGNLNSYEIEDPKANQGQDTSKVKIKF